jgi:hypothetical protein
MNHPIPSLVGAVPYRGRADNVWPPFAGGWAEVPYHHDEAVVGRAKALLGALPTYHYADETLPSGLYRFFAFETPVGTAVSALKFIGAEKARALMGAPTSEETAAQAMLDALVAHGYKQSDMGLYKAFQTAAGLTADGYPGTATIEELKNVIFGMGLAFPDLTEYPWLASGSYDGVNAPMWSTWAPGQPEPGSTTPTTPAATTASATGGSGTAVAVAALVAVAVGTIAVVAKSSGALALV